MVAILSPLDSLSGRGSYGMKGEIPLNIKDDLYEDCQDDLIINETLFLFC